MSSNVILDCGSGMIKAGIGGETMPRAVFPTLIGNPKTTMGMPAMGAKKSFIGDEAMAKKGILKLNFPIDNGNIKDWESMKQIWAHIFANEVRLDPKECSVLLTDPDRDPKINKEKMAQVLFEEFKVPSLYITNPGILSLYSSGVVTGVAVDCGDCLTLCVPGDQGMADPKAMSKKYFGGRILTHYLVQLLNEKENLFQTTGEEYTVKLIKEKACFVALDPADVSKESLEYQYLLPDGTQLTLTNERYNATEAFFKPELAVGKIDEGLHTFVVNSIKKSDEALQPSLFANIVLAGGSTLFEGLKERLEKELNALAPEGMPVTVTAPPNRMYSAWIGGSVMSSLSTFNCMWLTQAEYNEKGLGAIDEKFPV